MIWKNSSRIDQILWCCNANILLFQLNKENDGVEKLMKPKLGWEGRTVMSVRQYLWWFRSIWMWKISLGFPLPVTHGCILKRSEGFALKAAAPDWKHPGKAEGSPRGLGRSALVSLEHFDQISAPGGNPQTREPFCAEIISVFCNIQGRIPSILITCSELPAQIPQGRGVSLS